MDLIREHLFYSSVPVSICFGGMKTQEQYECIRLLLATRTKDVTICKHNTSNKYIEELLKLLTVEFNDCSNTEKPTSLFTTNFVLNS